MSKDERFYRAYMEHREVSRRGLLRGLFKGAQGAIEQESKTSLIKAEVIRPPGAVAEALFHQQCDGCGDCAAACPESLIVMDRGYPLLDFIANYCSRCGACVKSCKRGALQEGVFRLNGLPKVQHTCQNRYAYCDVCTRHCQREAIVWYRSQAPAIDAEKCDGCGECVFFCPVNALEMTIL